MASSSADDGAALPRTSSASHVRPTTAPSSPGAPTPRNTAEAEIEVLRDMFAVGSSSSRLVQVGRRIWAMYTPTLLDELYAGRHTLRQFINLNLRWTVAVRHVFENAAEPATQDVNLRILEWLHQRLASLLIRTFNLPVSTH